MEMSTVKELCRMEMKNRLVRMSELERAEKSYLASLNLMRCSEFKSAKTILAFKAMKYECDPALAVSSARDQGKRVAFPLCAAGNTLKIMLPSSERAFSRGAYGIWEPDEALCEELQPESLELIIAPGLAFDKNMARLGRGAGYYDRLLKVCKHSVVIGFTFDIQVIEKVPFSSHDIPMDKIVTNL